MPKPPDERVGRVVDDRYEILEAMAAGSMGAVYRAERVPVGKVVAIKFLHASFANDSEFLIRFERETQVMSKLAHPNCVSVVDFGVWEGAPYLVMDFVAGRTLRALIDDEPLAPARALLLARQIAAGLAHAHAQNIVHRDVKPANIMISDEIGTGERVRILDFGLARLRGAGGRDATQSNVVVGTPNYMAPEQTVGGGVVDARTDIYAAGVVLFEMIVGEKPFVAEETMQLLGMHRAAPIPKLVERVKGRVAIPPGLQELIERALAKRPDDRFQSGVEMADAIDDVLAAMADGGSPAGDLRVPGSAAVRAARKSQAVGMAPTMPAVDVASERAERSSERSNATTISDAMRPAPRAHRPWRRPILSGVILLGGIAAGAGYLIYRNGQEQQAAADAPSAKVALLEPAIDAPPPAVAVDAAEPDAAGSADAGSADAGSGSGFGSGSGSAEIDVDPTTAEDPNPTHAGSDATDEASDAPEIDKTPAVAQPVLAKSVPEAIALIKGGQRELALTSLRVLYKDQPRNAYIPFLLGNLYFDKLWWGVAMDHYQAAIAKNGLYKKNQILNQNVIRTLGSAKTQRRAQAFLRGTLGRDAIPYLRAAAAHDSSSVVRKQAAMLLKQIR